MLNSPNRFVVIKADSPIQRKIAKALIGILWIPTGDITIKKPKEENNINREITAYKNWNERNLDCNYEDGTKKDIGTFLCLWIIPEEVKTLNISVFKKDNRLLLYVEYDHRYITNNNEISTRWWIFDIRWRQILPWWNFLINDIQVFDIWNFLIFKIESAYYKVDKDWKWEWLDSNGFEALIKNSTDKIKDLWNIHSWLFN